MGEKIFRLLESLPATGVSTAFLVLHFIFPVLSVPCPIDPAWGAILISGLPLFGQAVGRLFRGKRLGRISSELLITIAMTAAVGIGDLFAAGEVAVIMAIGSILEERTVNRAKKGVSRLLSLAPPQGRRIRDGKEEMVPAEELQKGDILRILPGEAIPVDGVIVQGGTSVDQSIVTGESLPVDKGVGEELYCGTINRFGVVEIRATGVGEDSSLKKMVRLVQEAEEKKAPTERMVDRYASFMVPASLCLGFLVYFLTGEVTRAVTVLLVFCPCALTLATPTAIMAAIGQAARHGVIVRSGEALEAMGRVDTVAFDKTGTLTEGHLEVSDLLCLDRNLDERSLLSLAASAEAKSEHPLGKAIVACAKKRKVTICESEDFWMTSGKGVGAKIDGREILCGNERFLTENGVTLSREMEEAAGHFRSQGKAMILMAREKRPIGLVSLWDVIRPETKGMVERLVGWKVRPVLLTGDHCSTASFFAGQVGISEIHAGLLPEEKAGCIEALQAAGRRVCMIGDGVNDAPALKTADVGVAMGAMGSDIAVEAADIALMSDEISKIPYLKKLGLATLQTIRLSITAAMTINLIALLLSVIGLLGPTTGALVHNVGSCLVVLFAGLLYDRDLEREEGSSSSMGAKTAAVREGR